MTKVYNSRFKDAPWYEKSKDENILIVGAGGIGSNTIYNLAKTVVANYAIVDMDVVEEYNIGTQFFQAGQELKFKVESVISNVKDYGCLSTFIPVTTEYEDDMYYPITITCLDNMKTRKQCFDVWKDKEDRELFIDGRLRANLYEIYVVKPGEEEAYEKTLFDDDETDDGNCTFKQTVYVGMLIGARITQIIVNHLTNKYDEDGESFCVVPSFIQEFTEPFYINIKNKLDNDTNIENKQNTAST